MIGPIEHGYETYDPLPPATVSSIHTAMSLSSQSFSDMTPLPLRLRLIETKDAGFCRGEKKSTWAITWPIRHSWSRFKMGVPHLSSYIYTLANAPFWHFSHFTGGKVLAEEAATVPYIKVWVIRERDCDPEGDAAGMRAELKSTDSCNSELSHLSRETKTQSHNIEDVIKRRLTTYPSRCENFLWTYSENWSFKQSIKECVKGVGLPKM